MKIRFGSVCSGIEAAAVLGLGGRTKNGQIEFYDQYKDQIDA